jgi:hypothetical protein
MVLSHSRSPTYTFRSRLIDLQAKDEIIWMVINQDFVPDICKAISSFGDEEVPIPIILYNVSKSRLGLATLWSMISHLLVNMHDCRECHSVLSRRMAAKIHTNRYDRPPTEDFSNCSTNIWKIIPVLERRHSRSPNNGIKFFLAFLLLFRIGHHREYEPRHRACGLLFAP